MKIGEGVLEGRQHKSPISKIHQLTPSNSSLFSQQNVIYLQQGDAHHIKNDVSVLRLDLSEVHDAVRRCESLGMDSASELSSMGAQQNYVARGTRLLLKAVGTILPVEAPLKEELDEVSEQSNRALVCQRTMDESI